MRLMTISDNETESDFKSGYYVIKLLLRADWLLLNYNISIKPAVNWHHYKPLKTN